MKVKMLKSTPFLGVYRKVNEVHDIVDRGGGDVTAERWVSRGIAEKVSEDMPVSAPIIKKKVKE